MFANHTPLNPYFYDNYIDFIYDIPFPLIRFINYLETMVQILYVYMLMFFLHGDLYVRNRLILKPLLITIYTTHIVSFT